MNLLKAIFSGGGDSISVTEAKTRIETDKSVYILDVRQPAEFQSGHIAGAKLVPLNELSRKMDQIPKDRDIMCICRSGSRSGVAAQQLRQAGYRVINVRGGMLSWQSAGLPVKKGK